MLGSIIGAVAPAVVGGLFAKSSAKKERKNALADSEVQFERLRESAERAGFNPLTALQANGTAGFNNLPSGAMPPLASQRFITGALSGVSDAITTVRAERAAEDRKNAELAEIQLNQRRGGNYSRVVQSPQAPSIGVRKQPTLGAPAPTVLDANPIESMTMGPEWEKAEPEPMRGVPLTTEFRTGSKENPQSYRGFNPDAFESGVSEIIGSSVMHGAAWGLHQLTRDRPPQVDKQVRRDYFLPPLATPFGPRPQT